jgi:hypothetical protein
MEQIWSHEGDAFGTELDPTFAVHIFGDKPFAAVPVSAVQRYAQSTVLVFDMLRDLATTIDRFFACLYSLSDDQSIIGNLVTLASLVARSADACRCLLLIASQTNMLASLLIVLKVKSPEQLGQAKYDIAVVTDIVKRRTRRSPSARARRRPPASPGLPRPRRPARRPPGGARVGRQ